MKVWFVAENEDDVKNIGVDDSWDFNGMTTEPFSYQPMGVFSRGEGESQQIVLVPMKLEKTEETK